MSLSGAPEFRTGSYVHVRGKKRHGWRTSNPTAKRATHGPWADHGPACKCNVCR